MTSSSLVGFCTDAGIGVACIDHPPVNAISTEVTRALAAAMDAFEADASLRALVIHAAGRTFVAGADITEFARADFTAQPFNRLLARIEASPRIVVASLHGTVLGAGLELALACHYRVAQPATRLGFPEVKLGILPGSLGTQRAPRLAGVATALDMMLTGTARTAQDALAAGLVDEIRDGDPAAVGLAYAQALLAANARPRRASELATPAYEPDVFARRRESLGERSAKYPALARIVDCVEAAATRPFAQGEALEAQAFAACRRSPQSAALRHLFFAERAASRVESRDARQVDRVGVLGAGTMGSGIAIAFANAGIPVTLAETSEPNLARGLARVREAFAANADKGRITNDEAARRTALVQGTLAQQELAACDLVIEAVFEDLALKRDVCAALGRACKRGAIIATNTSTLDVDVLAEASGRPADFLGMHFFSPANVMRLLEVVRGARTSPAALATAMQLGKRIGKVPVVSGVCYGFIGNRMLEPYLREAERLLLEGVPVADIDGALESLGLAMGPLRMLDLAGVDVAAKVVLEREKAGTVPSDPAYRIVVRKLFELGRHGQKTGAGFYRYEGRKALADPAVDSILQELASRARIPRRQAIERDEIVERCLYPLINEGARTLEEGIAYRPGDIDVVYTSGFGFPDVRGGPMWMADEIGLPRIVARMDDLARETGNPYGYWDVCHTLRRHAREGKRFADWRGMGA